MVGPDAEKTASVRHAARLFVIGASLRVPYFTIAWPTGEFGAMGLEGAVKLGFRKELAQAGNPAAQKALYDNMVTAAYERGKAINMASFLEIDEVIDPMDSRRWIMAGLNAVPKSNYAQREGRGFVDTW